jgi:glutamate-1-semialdehyde 2,1-aminomutase
MTLLERADIIPGRSLTRSKKVFGRFAAFASGATITDTEGRQYIDMLCALGAVSLGYSQPQRYGSGVCSLPYDTEVDAAEAVLTHVTPWASWVRFTKTGSEATHAAYRMAKAVTGRDTVVRYAGSYHGWHEWSDANPSILMKGFVTPNEDVAAIFVEPARFQSEDIGFLRSLRHLCDVTGALLVFDSMIYGGRWHIGGTSGYTGVIPDMECFGKAYGNGQAVAFVVGTGETYAQGEIASGTYSGERSGLSAVIDTLKVYTTEPVIETMWERGRRLRAGLLQVIPPSLGELQGPPPCQHIEFVNPEHGHRFSQAMLERGVIWHPLPALTMYAHTVQQIDQVIEAAKDVVSSW